jgi:rhamnosyltransferase
MINPKVIAVVVTYQPDPEILTLLLKAVVRQVDGVIIVDNGSEIDPSMLDVVWANPEQISVFRLFENTGVAAAQNKGIVEVMRRNATHVLLLDQDSIPTADMVSKLICAEQELISKGEKIAAVGPCYQDDRNMDRSSFITVSGLQVVKRFCRQIDRFIESDVIISSGSLIPLSVLVEVGGPLTELFIDQVDFEWCFRAKSYGYRLFGVCDAVMQHSIGETPKNILGRKFLHHSPLRHYYIFRNAVWLLSKRYVPLGWKFLFIRTIFIRFIIYCVFIAPRLGYLKMMTKGVWHGLRSRTGRYGED